MASGFTSQRFPDGAQALGWYSYNTSQFQTARDWFRQALNWKPDDEPSAYGLALSTQRLNDRSGFNAIVTQWRDRSERIADLADGTTPVPAGRQRVSQVRTAQPAENVPQASTRPVAVQTETPRMVVERKETEITAIFAAVGALLAALAAGLSVWWFGRAL